jgi:hypothetical protein
VRFLFCNPFLFSVLTNLVYVLAFSKATCLARNLTEADYVTGYDRVFETFVNMLDGNLEKLFVN